MPTPQTANTAGWFQHGDPTTGTPSTVTSADWANAIQAELLNILAYANVTPSKTATNQVITSIVSLFRQKLTGNLNLYVNGTTGSDGNNGTSAAPFKTLQAAANYIIANLDLQGYVVTVNVAAGTYAGVLMDGNPVGSGGQGSSVIFNGDTNTPSNVVVSTGGDCFAASIARFSVQGFKLVSNSGCGINAAGSGSVIRITGKMEISSCYNSGIIATGCGIVYIDSGYTVSGSSASAWSASQGGQITMTGITITQTGTPTFSNAAVVGDGPSSITFASTTFSGSASGKCFNMQHGSYLYTGTGNTTFIPGTTAGTSTTAYFA